MRIFIAGVMQADREDKWIESQNYRVQISSALQTRFPDAEILDPWALNPDSVHYDDDRARNTFLSMTRLAATADLLIAYLPKLSMGTAMEMWQAFQAEVPVIAVTPFRHHWAIRFTAQAVLPDLETLLAQIADGRIAQYVNGRGV